MLKATSKSRYGFDKKIYLIFLGLLSGQTLAAYPISSYLSSLDGSNGSRIDGVLNGDFLGYSVSQIGDFNGDGQNDFAIGAPNAATLPGSVYVLYGKPGGLIFPINLATLDQNNEGFRIDGSTANAQTGTSIASAGDLNGDNLADLAIGSPGESSVYILFGKNGGYPGNFSLTNIDGLDNSAGFRIDGMALSDLGSSVANAGDINGDKLNDLIFANGAANMGVGYVIFGSQSAYPARIDVSTDLNGNNGFRITGAAINQSGFVVNGAGDVNGDGLADMLIGSWSSGIASVYMLFGQNPQNSNSPATVDLNSLNSTQGVAFTDGIANSFFGGAVAGIGDINHDGIDDFAIGAPMTSTVGSNQVGKTYVVFGSKTAFTTSPMNINSLVNGSNGFQVNGMNTAGRSGWAVAGAGDISGDGIADFAIGAPYSSFNGRASGTTYVILGKSNVFTSNFILAGAPATLPSNPPTYLDGVNGFQILGVTAGDQSGWSIAKGGDVNGDGADDLLIGARLASRFDGTTTLTNSGAGYIFYGQSADTTAPITTITQTPATNANGWNNVAVTLHLSAQDEIGGSGLKETRCALNPITPPLGFNDLTATVCNGISVNAEGLHSFYAASNDNANNLEDLQLLSLKIDLTAPQVKVNGVSNGATYKRDKLPKITCSTSDSLSGVETNASLTISGGNKRGTGLYTATCGGALDNAGNSKSVSVSYTVR